MADDNFCIDPRYIARTHAITHDQASGATYWNASRLRDAHSYQAGVYALAERELRRRAARTLIDVGCGPAPKLADIHTRNPELLITGVDQASAIAYCRRHHPWGTWLEEDLGSPQRTPDDIRGDIVICSDVIEHLLDPDVLLAYLRRRLAPGGLLVISTPDRDRLSGPTCLAPENPQHVREWSAPEFRRYLSSRGFQVQRQLHQWPIRAGLDRLFWSQVVLRALQRQHTRYNQVCLARSC